MPRERVLAWIEPVDVAPPPGLPGEPPTIWPSPGHPEQPIYWPPTVWPPPGHVEHPIVIIPPDFFAPGVPEHPIVLPTPPGTDPPPHVAHPIIPSVEHPIYFPKPQPPPILGDPHPEHPIWLPFPPPVEPPTGGLPPVVAHPIVLPNPKGMIVVFENYAGTPPPPEGVPSDHVPAVLWMGPGTLARVIWMPPLATPKTRR